MRLGVVLEGLDYLSTSSNDFVAQLTVYMKEKQQFQYLRMLWSTTMYVVAVNIGASTTAKGKSITPSSGRH